MKIKPKSVLVNLPIYVLFDTADELPQFAANINTILHGKVRLKYEEMGKHDSRFVGLFYLDRGPDYDNLREFVKLYLVDGEEAESLRQYKEEEELTAKEE